MVKLNTRNPQHVQQVRDIILAVAQADGEWQDIVTQVSQRFQVKNWLTSVRGILQMMKDEGIVVRDSNTRIERYHLVTK